MAAQPYYHISSIKTAQYTTGNEFIIDNLNQDDYVGLYHILPNGDYWTETSPSDKSLKLLKKNFKVSSDVKRYNFIRDIKQTSHSTPILFHPMPNQEDYKLGYINRYFVQKRNNPYKTIYEIAPLQYNTINKRNIDGLSAMIWNYVEIQWRISGVHAKMLNLQAIQTAEDHGFVNISKYLMNPLEFWK